MYAEMLVQTHVDSMIAAWVSVSPSESYLVDSVGHALLVFSTPLTPTVLSTSFPQVSLSFNSFVPFLICTYVYFSMYVYIYKYVNALRGKKKKSELLKLDVKDILIYPTGKLQNELQSFIRTASVLTYQGTFPALYLLKMSSLESSLSLFYHCLLSFPIINWK